MTLGDGAGWDETAPANGDAISDGATEMRDARVGVRIRLEKEHILPEAGSVGGEHLAGSAVVYAQDASPTTQPDGDPLVAADVGRVWMDTNDDNKLYVLTDDTPTWTQIVGLVSDGSIDTTQLADDAVDKDKVAADVAGDGLGQNVDGSLEVQVDDVGIEIDTDACRLKDEGVVEAKLAPGLMRGSLIVLEGFKTAGTAGGTFTSGAWRVREIDREVVDEGDDCSLASDQFTLAAGSYVIKASACAYLCGQHIAQLYNVSDAATQVSTDASTELVSLAIFSEAGVNAGNQEYASIDGKFTIAAEKIFEIRHRCITTSATSGFGFPANIDSKNEIYLRVMLWKVA